MVPSQHAVPPGSGRLGRQALCLVLVGTLGGAPAAEGGSDALLLQIERAIGPARCDDDAQCRVASIGANPCGSPEGFRAWSTRDTDATALARLLERHAADRRLQHERGEIRSTCSLLPVPAAACARSVPDAPRCVLLPAGPA